MSKVTCPHCSAEVRLKAFCGECGQPLPQPNASEREPDLDSQDSADHPATQHPSRKKRLFIVGAVTLLALMGFVGVWQLQARSEAKSKATCEAKWVYCNQTRREWKPDPKKNRIGGVLRLNDSDSYKQEVGSPCSGSGGYGDIDDGAQVTVKDEAGKIIATGRLANGKVLSSDTRSSYRFGSYDSSTTTKCSWDIEVDRVPKASVYQVEVSHRGELRYSLEEMKAQSWTVAFTLGD